MKTKPFISESVESASSLVRTSIDAQENINKIIGTCEALTSLLRGFYFKEERYSEDSVYAKGVNKLIKDLNPIMSKIYTDVYSRLDDFSFIN